MKIIAVTQDQIIIKDGVLAQVKPIGGYQMARGEWAVHFDTDLGIGHIEFTDSRRNQPLSLKEYEASYQWLESKHQEVMDYETKQAEQAAIDSDSGDTGSATV